MSNGFESVSERIRRRQAKAFFGFERQFLAHVRQVRIQCARSRGNFTIPDGHAENVAGEQAPRISEKQKCQIEFLGRQGDRRSVQGDSAGGGVSGVGAAARSEERRVGKEGGSTWRSRR